MKETLKELGLTEREAEAYLALYSFRETTATQLAKSAREHRTNIYDSLHGLVKKGLISYAIRNGVRHYRVSDPEKLVEYVKEKEKQAEDVLPELRNRLKAQAGKPIVEVYEGREGFKTILGRILREGKTIYGIGASEEWEKRFPVKLSQYMREREKAGIKGKLLYVKGCKPIRHRLNQVRYLPVEFQQPSTIAIFGDNVATFMWTEPLVATVTRSRELGNSFRKYFEVLWKNAKRS